MEIVVYAHTQLSFYILACTGTPNFDLWLLKAKEGKDLISTFPTKMQDADSVYLLENPETIHAFSSRSSICFVHEVVLFDVVSLGLARTFTVTQHRLWVWQRTDIEYSNVCNISSPDSVLIS